MSTDYEPTKEQVEAMLDEMSKATLPHFPDFREIARFFLRRQHEREEAILAPSREQVARYRPCMQCLNVAEKTLAAHAALDSPKVPTLRDLHEAFSRYESTETIRPLIAALVERAEKDGGR